VEANVVTDMCEEGAAGPYPTGKGYGIVDELMGVMGTVKTEGVDDEYVNTAQQGQLVVVDGLHVGDIGEGPEAVGKDRQLSVFDPDGHDANVAEDERLTGMYLVEPYGGHPWVAVLGKAVRQHLQHALAGVAVGIDIDLAELTVGSDIVHAAHMVVVGMCDEYAVDASEGLRQYLLTEVGTAVDEEPRLLCLDEYAAAQAFVTGAGAAAHGAPAADDGHAA